MSEGVHAFDADTHVNPATEVLDWYVDPSFRPPLTYGHSLRDMLCVRWARDGVDRTEQAERNQTHADA